MIHESGAAQLEFNFLHGNALDMADQTFLFKRTVRETALRHQDVRDLHGETAGETSRAAPCTFTRACWTRKRGAIFSVDENGKPSRCSCRISRGLQRYLPMAMPFFAPNVNSYRRIARTRLRRSTPIGARTTAPRGLRVPDSRSAGTRVENRVPGADANSYLALAVSLVCGYLGMIENIQPSLPWEESAYNGFTDYRAVLAKPWIC